MGEALRVADVIAFGALRRAGFGFARPRRDRVAVLVASVVSAMVALLATPLLVGAPSGSSRVRSPAPALAAGQLSSRLPVGARGLVSRTLGHDEAPFWVHAR